MLFSGGLSRLQRIDAPLEIGPGHGLTNFAQDERQPTPVLRRDVALPRGPVHARELPPDAAHVFQGADSRFLVVRQRLTSCQVSKIRALSGQNSAFL